MTFKQRLGNYITHKSSGEPYKAYIPQPLPPQKPPIDLQELYGRLERATQSLAQLNELAKSIPNPSLFVYMFVRKEALLSSQIEGTQSSFSDLMLFEHAQKPNLSIDDVEEVSNYVKALHYGIKRLQDGFPLSLRLLKEIHGILLSGSRGQHQSPGELRTSQNWIGGTRPGNALFVPPPPDQLDACLGDFEKFLHDKKSKLPVLIKIGLAHVQFESIHPFLDGNGRLGRLLIALLLFENGILDEPVLYVSLYFKQHRQTYYDLLQEVRTNGSWETWLEFFLDGIQQSAKQGIETIRDINALFANDFAKIQKLGRAQASCSMLFEYLKKMPQVSVPMAAKELGLSAPTVRSALNRLTELGVTEESSGKERDKIYVYKAYLSVLEAGT